MDMFKPFVNRKKKKKKKAFFDPTKFGFLEKRNHDIMTLISMLNLIKLS